MNAFLLLWVSFFSWPFTQISPSEIQVNIPTLEQEASYVWMTIRDTPFFDQNNYQVKLPKGALIEKLTEKARSSGLEETDYASILTFLQDSVYNREDYEKGYQKIVDRLPFLNQLLVTIKPPKSKWSFKAFERYEVNLTLYGPGGSYNPEEGSILMFTTPEGKFKNYDDPANTVIHEIVHIGLEDAIINKYKVPHQLKERIVDTFVSLSFGDQLTGYKIQDMGDYRIDRYLKDRRDLRKLDKYVRMVIEEK